MLDRFAAPRGLMGQFRAPVWQNNLKRLTEFRLTLALLSRFINWLKRVYPVR
jgi:hypothetical protein